MQTVRWGPAPTVRKGVTKKAANSPKAKTPKPNAATPAKKASTPKEKTSWIQCDKCQKWRIVPQSYMDQLGDDDAWKCEMNPNAAKAAVACRAPEDTE
jgi:hypothetical protein